MRKIIERVLLFVVAPLALLLTTAEMWRASLEEQYQERLTALRLAGEPTTFEEMVDPERVAAYQPVRDAVAWYRAYVRERGPEPDWENGYDEEDWTDDDWDRIARYYGDIGPFIDQVERASHGGPFQWRADMEVRGPSDLVYVRRLTEGLSCWIGIHTRREDGSPEVIRAAGSLLRVADRVECNWLMDFMVLETMRSVAQRGLCEAARRETFDLNAAMRILGPLLQKELRPLRLARVLRHQRVRYILSFDQLLEGNGADAFLENVAPRADRTALRALETLLELRSTRGLAYKAILRYLDYAEEAIRLVKRPPLEAMPALVEHMQRHQGSGPLREFTAFYCSTPPACYSHALIALAYQRLCRIELALRLFHRRHGRWPASLDELPGPQPLNPYRAEPFRYENGVLWAEPPLEHYFDRGEDDLIRVELADQR